MPAAIDDPELTEFLRLKACPACEYSLETLPLAGRCPECGQSYDQQFAVLTGLGRGRHESIAGGTWRGILGTCVFALMLMWLLASHHRFLMAPNAIAWIVIAGMTTGAQIYARVFSPREPRMQLWISRHGIAQISSTSEARQAVRIASYANMLFIPLVIALLVFDLHLSRTISSAIVASLGLLSILLIARRWKHERRINALHLGPPLWPWPRIETLTATPLPHNRCRIRCRTTRYWRKISVDRPWIVDVEIPCPPNIVAKLNQLKSVRWSDPPSPPSYN